MPDRQKSGSAREQQTSPSFASVRRRGLCSRHGDTSLETWRLSAITEELRLPLGANPYVVTLTFVASLVLLYVFLIRVWRLDKIGWKRVDYIWLALSALGVYGAVQSVRVDFAKDRLELSKVDAERAWSSLLYEADLFASSTGPICHMRQRVEESLAEARRVAVQDQFKRQCALLETYNLMLRKRDSPAKEDYRDLPEPRTPRDISAELDGEMQLLGDAWHRVADDSGIVRNLSQVKVRGPFETFLFDLAPFALAIAIAFRTVKTVGEIRLEKRSKLPIGK
jgi:hypothetical protein